MLSAAQTRKITSRSSCSRERRIFPSLFFLFSFQKTAETDASQFRLISLSSCVVCLANVSRQEARFLGAEAQTNPPPPPPLFFQVFYLIKIIKEKSSKFLRPKCFFFLFLLLFLLFLSQELFSMKNMLLFIAHKVFTVL